MLTQRSESIQRRAFQPTKEQPPAQADLPTRQLPRNTIHLQRGSCRQSSAIPAQIGGGCSLFLLGVDWIWRQRSRWSRGLQADNRQSKNRFSGSQRHACCCLSVGTTKVQPFTEKSLEGFYFVILVNCRQETLKNLGQKLNLLGKLKIIDKKFCRLLKKSYLYARNT